MFLPYLFLTVLPVIVGGFIEFIWIKRDRPLWLRKAYWPVALIVLLAPHIWWGLVLSNHFTAELNMVLAIALSSLIVISLRRLSNIVRNQLGLSPKPMPTPTSTSALSPSNLCNPEADD